MLFKLLLYWSILNTMWLFIRIRMISHNHDPINQAKIRMPSIRSPRGDYCFPLKLVRRKNKLLLKASKSRRCEKTPSSSPLCGTTQTRHWFFTSFNSLQRGCDSDIYIGIHGGDPGWTTNTQSKILSLSLFLSLLIVYYPFHSIPLSRLARGERIVRSAQHRRPVHTPSAHILYI